MQNDVDRLIQTLSEDGIATIRNIIDLDKWVAIELKKLKIKSDKSSGLEKKFIENDMQRLSEAYEKFVKGINNEMS